MIEIKIGQNNYVPVRMVDSLGTPVTGVVYTDVSVSVKMANALSITNFSPSSPQWTAVNASSFSNTGVYYLVLPSSLPIVRGSLTYAVSAPGCETYIGSVNAVTYIEDDTYIRMRQLQEGRWKIHTTGPDANRLVLYSSDGTTPIQKWDLKDSAGVATAGVDVFERVPTESIP